MRAQRIYLFKISGYGLNVTFRPSLLLRIVGMCMLLNAPVGDRRLLEAAQRRCDSQLVSLAIAEVVAQMKTQEFWSNIDFVALLNDLNPLGVSTETLETADVARPGAGWSAEARNFRIFRGRERENLENLYTQLGHFFLQEDAEIERIVPELHSLARAPLNMEHVKAFSELPGGVNRFRLLQVFITQKVLPRGNGNPVVASRMRLAQIEQPPPYLRALTAPGRLLGYLSWRKLRHFPTTFVLIPWARLRLWMKAGGRGDVIPTELLRTAIRFFIHGRQMMDRGVPTDLQWADLPDEYKAKALDWMNAREAMGVDTPIAGQKTKPEEGWTKAYIELVLDEGLKQLPSEEALTRANTERLMEEGLGPRNYKIYRTGIELAGDQWREALLKERQRFLNEAFVDVFVAAKKLAAIRFARQNSVASLERLAHEWPLEPAERERLQAVESEKLDASWAAEEKSAMRAFATAAMRGRLIARSLGADLPPQLIRLFREDPRFTYFALLDRLDAERNMTPEQREKVRKDFENALLPAVAANLHMFPEAVEIINSLQATNIKGKSDKVLAWVKSISGITIALLGVSTVKQAVSKLDQSVPPTQTMVYKVTNEGLNPEDPFGDPTYQKLKKEFLDGARLNGLDPGSAAVLRDFLRFITITNLAPEIQDEFEMLQRLKARDPADPFAKDFDDFTGPKWGVGAYEKAWSLSGWKFHGLWPRQWERPFRLSKEEIRTRSAQLEAALNGMRLMNTIALQAARERDRRDRFILKHEVEIAAEELNRRRAKNWGLKPKTNAPSSNAEAPK